MSYTSWHVGMKVVCVDAEWTSGAHAANGVPCPLQLDKVYVITKMLPNKGIYSRPHKAPFSVELEGVIKPGAFGGLSATGFNAARFRPVKKRATDISIFTQMLNPQKQDVDA